MLSQKELANIYNILDLFIFPTERASESLGLVAIEAMACGCPVIASDYAAPKYYIENDYNGYKFEKGNYEELATFIMNTLSDESKLDKLSNGALATAKEFSRSKILNKLKVIIKE